MTHRPLEIRLRPRKKPRQRRSEETRTRILDAARDVFANHGYAKGTTNRIAAAAGMSVGSLYQYFPNKDSILVELVEEHVNEGTAAVMRVLPDREHVTDADGLAQVVRAVVGAMVELHAEDRKLHRVLFEESPRPPALLDRLHQLERTAVEAVAEMLGTAGVGGADPAMRARMTVVAVESLVHRLIASDDTMAPSVVADEVSRLALAYLGIPVTSDS